MVRIGRSFSLIFLFPLIFRLSLGVKSSQQSFTFEFASKVFCATHTARPWATLTQTGKRLQHDGAFFESAGIPSVALVSDAFKPQAQFQASNLGLQDQARVYVSHPISDQTPAALHAKADKVFDKVRIALESNEPAPADETPDEVTAKATAACST